MLNPKTTKEQHEEQFENKSEASKSEPCCCRYCKKCHKPKPNQVKNIKVEQEEHEAQKKSRLCKRCHKPKRHLQESIASDPSSARESNESFVRITSDGVNISVRLLLRNQEVAICKPIGSNQSLTKKNFNQDPSGQVKPKKKDKGTNPCFITLDVYTETNGEFDEPLGQEISCCNLCCNNQRQGNEEIVYQPQSRTSSKCIMKEKSQDHDDLYTKLQANLPIRSQESQCANIRKSREVSSIKSQSNSHEDPSIQTDLSIKSFIDDQENLPTTSQRGLPKKCPADLSSLSVTASERDVASEELPASESSDNRFEEEKSSSSCSCCILKKSYFSEKSDSTTSECDCVLSITTIE